MSALAGLPEAIFSILPELTELDPPAERRADCGNCPIACDPAELPTRKYGFHPDARCCTYHPLLANWIAGRALRSGGTAEAVVRARMQDPEGVGIEGIRPTANWDVQRTPGMEPRFGRDLTLRCPYWVGGTHACGIWQHREGVCRSWFCLSEDGPRSSDFWVAMKSLLNLVEYQLRTLCIELGKPPGEGASPEEMAAWYLWCAQQVDELDATQVVVLRQDPQLQAALRRVTERRGRIGLPMPARLGASVRGMMPAEDGHIEFSGYAGLDRVVLPPTIFRFIGRLDGNTDWQPALDAANAELPPEAQIAAETVELLYRRGILSELGGPEDLEPGFRIVPG